MASTGSACHADSKESSAVLTALGIAREDALGAVRLSLGRGTTEDEISAAATSLGTAWRLLSNTTTAATA
jgi:cysteine desulfurase